MPDTECARCGIVICGCQFHTIQWLGECPYCERCLPIAKEDARINADEARNEARREVTGAKW